MLLLQKRILLAQYYAVFLVHHHSHHHYHHLVEESIVISAGGVRLVYPPVMVAIRERVLMFHEALSLERYGLPTHGTGYSSRAIPMRTALGAETSRSFKVRHVSTGRTARTVLI